MRSLSTTSLGERYQHFQVGDEIYKYERSVGSYGDENELSRAGLNRSHILAKGCGHTMRLLEFINAVMRSNELHKAASLSARYFTPDCRVLTNRLLHVSHPRTKQIALSPREQRTRPLLTTEIAREVHSFPTSQQAYQY